MLNLSARVIVGLQSRSHLDKYIYREGDLLILPLCHSIGLGAHLLLLIQKRITVVIV